MNTTPSVHRGGDGSSPAPGRARRSARAALTFFCITAAIAFCEQSSAQVGKGWRPPVAATNSLAAGGGGGGTITFVGVSNGTEESDGSQAVTRTITAGNLLVIAYKHEDSASVPSISDSVGNTYTTVVRTNVTGNSYCGISYAKNITGGASVVITINFGGGLSHNFSVLEFAGASLTAPLDTFAHGVGTGTAVDTFNMSTANASEGLVCVISRYNAGTVTEQATWTEDYDTSALEVQHLITTVSGTYKGSGTINSSMIWASCVAAFK